MRVPFRFQPSLESLEGRWLPSFYGNSLFPTDNPWNQKITNAPVAANSDAIVQHIVSHAGGSGPALHPDFGNPVIDNALYGIPVNVVSAGQATSQIIIPSFGYGSESDNPGAPIPIPIPANAVIEGDGPTGPASPIGRGDSHLIVYDKSANIVYELFNAVRPTESTFPSYDSNPGPAHPVGQWGALGEAVWDLNKNTFRTLGWTSADAAGLPILPGLARPDEALPTAQGGQGVITHALRMTVRDTLGDPNLTDYIYPASHVASNKTGSNLPRMGERFRLKASFVIPSTWPAEDQAIAQAMKDYGLIVADNGSDMFVSGTPSTQWNDNNLNLLKTIHASDFEVVDLTPSISGLSVTSGPVAGGTPIVITGRNFSGAAGDLHVTFGSVPAASFAVISDTQINVIAPAHAAGTVDIRVTAGSLKQDVNSGKTVLFGYGSSALTTADQFTFGGTGNGGSDKTITAVGEETGGSAVRVYNGDGSLRYSFNAYPGFAGGVRVAVADVTGDGIPDIITAAGPGGGPHVKVFDGSTGSPSQAPTLIRSFFAYGALFTGGVYVAAGDINGDGKADIITGAGAGGGPHVIVFDGATNAVLYSYYAYGATFSGGVRVAAADVTGDGKADIITGAGIGGGPHVRVFDGTNLSVVDNFMAFDPTYTGGVFVTGGDLDGDGKAEMIVSQGKGAGAHIRWFRGSDGSQATDFVPFASGTDGIRVAVADADADGKVDIVASAGPGLDTVRDFSGLTYVKLREFDAFDPTFIGGVFVG